MFFIDIAVPRDIDPAVREVPGVFLYDIDDLERVVAQNLCARRAAAAEAERIVAGEVQACRRRLAAHRVVPTIAAVREHLEEIRRQELKRYRTEVGPLGPAEEQALETFSSQLVQRIAGQLAHELKEIPEKPEQEELSAVVRRRFGLQREGRETEEASYHASRPAFAGTD